MKFTPYAVGCGAQLNPNFSSARCTSVTPCNTCILKAEINGLRQQDLENDVTAVLRLLEAGEWAEHCTSSPLGKRLESAITALHVSPFDLKA